MNKSTGGLGGGILAIIVGAATLIGKMVKDKNTPKQNS